MCNDRGLGYIHCYERHRSLWSSYFQALISCDLNVCHSVLMYEIFSIWFFSLSFSIFHFISSVHFYYFHTCRCNVRQAQTDCPDRQKAKSNLTGKCRARNNSDFLFESVRGEVILTVWWIRSFFTSNRIWLPNAFTFDWFLWVIINNVIGDNVFSIEYKIRDLNNEFPKKLAISIWMINILGFWVTPWFNIHNYTLLEKLVKLL